MINAAILASTLYAPFYAVMIYFICGALGVSGHGLFVSFTDLSVLCLTQNNFVQEQNHII